MQYTVDYFISKFESMPDQQHGRGSAHCAYWHCGLFGGDNTIKEAIALSDLFIKYFPNEQHINKNTRDLYHGETSWFVVMVNDGTKTQYKHETPKQRILAALRDIKKMQESSQMPISGQNVQASVATKPIVVQELGQYKNISKQIAVLPVDEKSDLHNSIKTTVNDKGRNNKNVEIGNCGAE